MISLKNKKTVYLAILITALTISITACSSTNNAQKQKTISKQGHIQSTFMDEYLESEWLNEIEFIEFNDIEKTEDKISYKFLPEETSNYQIKKVVSYEKDEKNLYNGTMKINFSKLTDTYVVEIPKSFASHIDQLNFSIEPQNIINPDPIVEFKNVQGDVSIESKESKTEDEIYSELEKQIIDTETKRCENLQGNESLKCILSLISKYRNSDYIEKELKHMNLTELIGASAQAILKSDLRTCRHVTNKNDKDLCYEYSYQILVKDCNNLKGSDYRKCVRKHSNNFPSLKEQRLFCAYIDDEDMRKECQGIAPLETCNEIENEDENFVCKLNILRTINDLSECNKIEDTNLNQACFAVIGADRKDANICKQINDEYLKGQCLTKVAMLTKNKNLCSIIVDEDSQDICNGFFIMKIDATKEMCESTNELFLKELCEMSLAILEKDIGKCQKAEIIGYDNISTCLAGIGMKHNDIKACDMIDINIGEFEEDKKLREMTKDLCYLKIAENKNDPSICQKITDPKQKNICENSLKKENASQKEANLNQDETPKMTCKDVLPPICPLDNKLNKGATIHLEDNEHDVQCTYYKNKEAGYPLYNEMYKLGKTRDGSYKKYNKSGNIEVFSEHTDGKADGFRIECNASGELTSCQFYNPGSRTLQCMP